MELNYRLQTQGLAKFPQAVSKTFTEKPEIMHLRFDEDHAPMDWIPADLRRKLIPIYAKYTQGALKKTEEKWHLFDPLTDPEFEKPYQYEVNPVAIAEKKLPDKPMPSAIQWNAFKKKVSGHGVKGDVITASLSNEE
jgi:hypothetical protein